MYNTAQQSLLAEQLLLGHGKQSHEQGFVVIPRSLSTGQSGFPHFISELVGEFSLGPRPDTPLVLF